MLYDASAIIFLSTLSLRRATEQSSSYSAYLEISIHALLAESDLSKRLIELWKLRFLSTLSLRRATGCGQYCTHAQGISIHALLAESDRISSIINNVIDNFYPRSPCGERPFTTTITICTALFLSTLSLRRATAFITTITICTASFLSTLSLRRATMIHPHF